MRPLSVLAIAVAIAGCNPGGSEDRTYTLYRNSVTDSNMRLHIATFDASEKEEYNRENCDIARQLFGAQPGIKVRYWCEKGRYKK
jgi:hypothetical protein